MGKTKNKIRVRFIGENAEDVTGSCTLIEMEKHKILLECGLFQSNDLKRDYKINNRRLDFKPSEVDYIFISHLHIDHCGLVARLYAEGCKAKIIVPEGSRAIFSIMAKDSAYIMSKDVKTMMRKYGKEVLPIYTAKDVETTLPYLCEYPIDSVVALDNDITFRFTPSGHIINSAQIELWLTQNNHTSKILYTGDLGNYSVPKHYVSTFSPVNHANLVIAESTYGGDDKKSVNMDIRKKDIEKIESVVGNVSVFKQGKVLIPVFALDRAQNILTCLYDLFGDDPSFNVPIVVDSPLTCKLFNAYASLLSGDELEKFKSVVSWKNVTFVSEYADSLVWQTKKEPMIILAASGFLQAGRARQWVKLLLPNPRNHILFVGYSSPDSLAGKIKLRGCQKTISIDGKPIVNRCGITNLVSFTSHIQHDDMLKYYSDINCEKICLVHGEMKSKCAFGKDLQGEIQKKSKTSKVVIINKSSEILL